MEINQKLLYMNLQFFADSAADKTEEPTTKKLNDAREEGQVAKSTELITGVSLMSLFVIAKIFIGMIGNHLLESYSKYYGVISSYAQGDFDKNVVHALISDALFDVVIIGLPIFVISYVTTFLIVLVQVKWKISLKPMKMDLKKFNPISGFKRIVSKDKIVDLIKAVIKILVIFGLVYIEFQTEWEFIKGLYDIELKVAIVLIGNMVINLGLKISALYLLIGFADLFYQKWKFKKDNRMSKQEVKDEYKNSEGDPQVKGQIKSKMREASQRRMMQSVPEADVIITNPTHFAVALKYDRESQGAPVVIAKGADLVAQRIKDKARESHIEIVENKPLARMLYFNVEIGDEIPGELYQMVAEVLAYVYSLKSN
ncbi:flagellar biosynthesis protein FlhB [Lachnospiraceae bacterium KM106-2]|nr:flagellar biosynthesis protein FlhB [Lachnospiraceae bacterium KM106-2]